MRRKQRKLERARGSDGRARGRKEGRDLRGLKCVIKGILEDINTRLNQSLGGNTGGGGGEEEFQTSRRVAWMRRAAGQRARAWISCSSNSPRLANF